MLHSFENKITQICNGIVKYSIYGILLFTILSFVICYFTVGNNIIGMKGQIITALSTLLIFLFFWKFKWISTSSIKSKYLLIIGLAIANIIMLSIWLSYDTKPVSDYKEIWEMANSMANGKYDVNKLNHWDYKYVYNWQTGMAVLESIIIRFFGPNFIVLKVFNQILITCTILTTYYLAKLTTGKRIAIISFLLMCCYYPILVTVGQLSNQNVAGLLILLFIIFIEKKWFIAAGILLPILSFIRPMGIILLITLFAFIGYNILAKKWNIKEGLIKSVCFMIPFVGTTYIIDSICIKANYTDSPVSQAKIPYFKFHKGLGEYNWPYKDIINYNGDLDRFNQWEKEEVISAYKNNTLSTLGGNVKKMFLYLGWYDWKFEMTYNKDESVYHQKGVSNCVAFGWAQYLMLVILCLFGYKRYYERNRIDFLQIFFIGITIVYFFIEAWTSYRYESYPIMFIIGGLGIQRLRNFNIEYIKCKCSILK